MSSELKSVRNVGSVLKSADDSNNEGYLVMMSQTSHQSYLREKKTWSGRSNDNPRDISPTSSSRIPLQIHIPNTGCWYHKSYTLIQKVGIWLEASCFNSMEILVLRPETLHATDVGKDVLGKGLQKPYLGTVPYVQQLFLYRTFFTSSTTKIHKNQPMDKCLLMITKTKFYLLLWMGDIQPKLIENQQDDSVA